MTHYEAPMDLDQMLDDVLDDEDEYTEYEVHHAPVAPEPPNSDSEPEVERRRTGKSKRKQITEKDLEVISFIARFKVANTDQLALITGVKPSTMQKRLIGLKDIGLVNSIRILTGRKVWFATKLGLDWVESMNYVDDGDCTLVSAGDLQYNPNLGHSLAVSHVASQLLSGTSGITTNPCKMEHLVSEYQIDSQWKAWKEAKVNAFTYDPASGPIDSKVIYSLARSAQLKETPLPFLTLIGEWELHSKAFHNADLALIGGKGQKFGIEVELTMKKPAEYQKILMNYKQGQGTFEKVYWFTTSEATARRIMAAAEAISLPKERISCRPLLGHDGEPFTGSAYNL